MEAAQAGWFRDLGLIGFNVDVEHPSYIHIGVYSRGDSKEAKDDRRELFEFKKESKRARIVKLHLDGLSYEKIALLCGCATSYVIKTLRYAMLIEDSGRSYFSGGVVVAYKDGVEVGRFKNAASAARAYGIDDSRVSKVLRRIESHCKGYVFAWEGEDKNISGETRKYSVPVVKVDFDGNVTRYESIRAAAKDNEISTDVVRFIIEKKRTDKGYRLYKESDYEAEKAGIAL